eukprot:768005-Hanusia_phi.AAC.2
MTINIECTKEEQNQGRCVPNRGKSAETGQVVSEEDEINQSGGLKKERTRKALEIGADRQREGMEGPRRDEVVGENGSGYGVINLHGGWVRSRKKVSGVVRGGSQEVDHK